MGKIVSLIYENENYFSKTIEGTSWKDLYKKQIDFIFNYQENFFGGLAEINPYMEFNSNYSIGRFNALTNQSKLDVLRNCGEIYAYNDKLNYSEFIDLVDFYASREGVDVDFNPSGGAA